MFVWFLSLFPEYRAVRDGFNSTTALLSCTQLEIDSLKAENTRLREGWDSAANESMKAVKMVSNWQAIQAGSPIVPFPDVHVEMQKIQEPPLNPVNLNGIGPRLARDVQRSRVLESRRKAAADHQVYMAAQKENLQKPDVLGLDDL